jgi:hypothetical protein
MRSKFFAVGLALVTLVAAVPAFADNASPTFPIPAATFQQHVDARMAKAREHMEAHAAKLPADQATALRAKFDASVAAMNAEVAKAVADGTVTKEEAQAVRAAGPHGGRGHCEGKEKKQST